jgi:hypothetical protein
MFWKAVIFRDCVGKFECIRCRNVGSTQNGRRMRHMDRNRIGVREGTCGQCVRCNGSTRGFWRLEKPLIREVSLRNNKALSMRLTSPCWALTILGLYAKMPRRVCFRGGSRASSGLELVLGRLERESRCRCCSYFVALCRE